MATQYSNKPIVTNGLVYALDFGNPRSYISGSTSAKSLFFNNTTASISAGFDIATTALAFSGSQNATTNLSFTQIDANRSFSISYVANIKGNGVGFGGNYIGPILSSIFNTTTTLVGFYGAPFPGFGNTNYNRTYNTSGNNHYTWVYSSGSSTFYINGIPIAPSAINTGVLVYNGSEVKLSGRASDSFWSGSLNNFYVYNKALSSTEVWQNYQLAAQRYGLGLQTVKPYTLDENAYLYIQAAGITDPIITGSINTFVLGLKATSLWDKMIAIYPFAGNTTGSQRWNLKEASTVTYPLTFTGQWTSSSSGSIPSGTSSINTTVTPNQYYPNASTQSAHLTVLSYDLPTTSSFLAGTAGTVTTSSFVIFQTETATTGAINNEIQSGITGSGNIGLITVSRTGSNALTLHKNTNSGSFSVPASSSLATSIYLDAANVNGTATSFSPYNLSYASVGIGLTPTEVATYHNLVGQLQTNLKRKNTLLDNYTGAAAAYSLRRIGPSGYFGPAIRVRRDSDNTLRDIGFTSDGQLDTVALLDFVGVTGSGFVNTWYDQSGNSKNATQGNTGLQPFITISGSVTTEDNKVTIYGPAQRQLSAGNLIGPSHTWFSVHSAKPGNDVSVIWMDGTPGYVQIIGYSAYGVYPDGFTTDYFRAGSGTAVQYTSYWGPRQLKTSIYTENYILSDYKFGQLNHTQTFTQPIVASGGTLTFGPWSGGSTSLNRWSEFIYYTGSAQAANRTAIETNINNQWKIYGSATASFDPDYSAFITATGITQPTQSAALETLVSDLKSYGLWNKMKAIYPMITDKYNLYSNTENLSTGWLTVSSSLTASNAAGPFTSSLVANRLVEGSGTVTPTVYQTVTLVSGSSYVMSTYARWNGRDYLVLNPDANSATWFDIKNGYVSSSIGTAFSSSIQRVSGSAANPSGSWYRCSMMFNAVVSTAQNTSIQLSDADGVLTYTGGGASGSYLWGTQFENGTFLSPYLSNTTNVAYTTASMLTQMKYNLKNPADTDAAFRLTYSGSWTPGYIGVKGDGIAAYADTKLNVRTNNSVSNLAFGSYWNDYVTNNSNKFYGAYDGGGISMVSQKTTIISGDQTGYMASFTGVSATQGNGLHILSRISPSQLMFYRNTSKTTATSTADFQLPNLNFWLGGVSGLTNFGYIQFNYAFSFLSNGLTDYEAKALYWIVQKYQTTLGRQVY